VVGAGVGYSGSGIADTISLVNDNNLYDTTTPDYNSLTTQQQFSNNYNANNNFNNFNSNNNNNFNQQNSNFNNANNANFNTNNNNNFNNANNFNTNSNPVATVPPMVTTTGGYSTITTVLQSSSSTPSSPTYTAVRPNPYEPNTASSGQQRSSTEPTFGMNFQGYSAVRNVEQMPPAGQRQKKETARLGSSGGSGGWGSDDDDGPVSFQSPFPKMNDQPFSLKIASLNSLGLNRHFCECPHGEN